MKRTIFFVGAVGLALNVAAASLFAGVPPPQEQAAATMTNLVPKIEPWAMSEDVQSYFPENLFEYINGAAESYLSYDFKALVVAQFEKDAGDASVTLEIYDMGTPLNAFGIFSAERYPENRTLPVGDAAYIESESLNFLSGKYYVKLLGFGAGEETESVLQAFANGVAARVQAGEGLPSIFRAMPVRGQVPQSEKFIKKNFLGYEFLNNGFVASYKVDTQEIECFVVESGSDKEAESMEGRLLDFFAKDKQVPEKIISGYHVRSRYAQHFYLGRTGRYLFGVVRVPDGLETAGERYLDEMKNSLGKRGGGG